jgi:hypothetical protein
MKIYFLIFLTIISIQGFSQSDTTTNIESEPHLSDTLIPYNGAITKDVEFSGGYRNYIIKEIFNYIPKSELKKIPERTRIFISIIITKNGSVRNFEIIRSCNECEKINQALKNLFINMHGWSPALDENSNPVDRKIAIPIYF